MVIPYPIEACWFSLKVDKNLPHRAFQNPGEKLVVVDKSDAGKGGKAASPAPAATEETRQDPADTSPYFDVQDRLARARANRSHAETARQKIINEIMEASKALYQKLVEDGSHALERARQLETDAGLRRREVQRELENSSNIRAEADAYREQVIAQTQREAQEMLQQAHAIKAEAIAFREKLLEQVRKQAQEELEQAQSERLNADAYREKVIAESQRQAKEVLEQARSSAQQEGAEIVQRCSVEAERILAQAELVKAAAQEQLEAQRLYADIANLETESREVLEQARARLSNPSPQSEEEPSQEEEDKNGNEETPDPAPPPDDSDDTLRDEALLYERLLKLGNNSDAEDPVLPDTEDFQSHEGESGSIGPAGLCAGRAELPDNELVLGLEIGDRSKAYPLKIVTEARVINDSFNQQDVVITFGPPSELGMIFNRNVEGRSLTFHAVPETAHGLMLMKDQETGTTWEALTGRGISGPLVHAELHRINYEYSFWFAWKDLHPQSEVYTPERKAPAARASH